MEALHTFSSKNSMPLVQQMLMCFHQLSACAAGTDANNNLTQTEPYGFMDLMCTAGFNDVSAFTFFGLVQGPGGAKNPIHHMTISDRYFEALSYFQTGQKGLILP